MGAIAETPALVEVDILSRSLEPLILSRPPFCPETKSQALSQTKNVPNGIRL